MSLLSDKAAQRVAATRKPAEPSKTSEPAAPADPLADVVVSAEEFTRSKTEGLDVVVDPPPTPPPAAEEPKAKEQPKPTRVRVLEPGKIMLGGCMQRFKRGAILDQRHYDPEHFRQLLTVLTTEPVTG
jgi:hypothetical protein